MGQSHERHTGQDPYASRTVPTSFESQSGNNGLAISQTGPAWRQILHFALSPVRFGQVAYVKLRQSMPQVPLLKRAAARDGQRSVPRRKTSVPLQDVLEEDELELENLHHRAESLGQVLKRSCLCLPWTLKHRYTVFFSSLHERLGSAVRHMGLVLFIQQRAFVAALVGAALLGLTIYLVTTKPSYSAFGVLSILGYFFGIRPVYQFYISLRRSWHFHDVVKSKDCAPAAAVPTPLFGTIRHKLNLLLYPGGDLLDDVFAKKYEKYGATHALHDRFGVPKVIHTIDPANVNAIMRTQADDWRPAKGRANTMYPLAQEGLLNSEGEAWSRNRKLILRHINTKRVKDVRSAESDVQLLFDTIGPADHDGWTETVDLLDLFHRLSLDMSTMYLLGTSANSQLTGVFERKRQAAMAEYDLIPNNRDQKMSYGEAYEIVRNYFSWRSKLGSKYWIADSPKYREACATLNDFADDLIQRAMNARSDNAGKSEDNEHMDSKYGLIDSLVKEIGDPVHIRNLIMDLFIAGQNMTGTLAAWIFAQLSANPDIFDRLRAEVVDKFGTEDSPLLPLTWDNLRSCSTMQNVIRETLRMYPLLANIGRNAKCDTVLPRGGGPDGSQPIAVPKGCTVTCNIYLTHRRAEEWGDDAWEFKPDRWIGRKVSFGEYAPFGAGPRICIGQQLALTEISFVLARMLQRFDGMRVPLGQDNLVKGYRVVVAPKNGVKVQLRRAREGKGECTSPTLGAQAG